MHEIVIETRERSEWSARATLKALGIAARSYYRWLKEEKWARSLPAVPVKRVQPYEALPEEKEAEIPVWASRWSHSTSPPASRPVVRGPTVWEPDPVAMHADDAFRAELEGTAKPERPTLRDEAETWLRTLLSGSVRPTRH